MARIKTKTKVNVGRQIAALRAEMGITQHVLAVKIGCTAPMVANWESGYNTPSGDYMDAICDLFGVDIKFVKRQIGS